MEKYNTLLAEILTDGGISVLDEKLYRLTYDKIRAKGYNEIVKAVFSDLGGIGKEFPVNLPASCYQINGVYFYLDGPLHFNRYRKITLRAPLYDHFNGFSLNNYRRYCRNFEKECLKTGTQSGYWTDGESEKFFGKAGNPGEFLDNGPSRWKWLAFQDFLMDLNFSLHGQKLKRISYYDQILIEGKLTPIGNLLTLRNQKYFDYLANFLIRLTKKPE